MIQLLTGEGLRNICPNLSPTRANKIADDMLFILPHFKIYNKEVLPDFIAQCAVESGQFRLKTENLNYTTAAQIAKTWPTRFTVASAAPFVKQPVLLSNEVYGGRNGNIKPNDGWDFRGAGFIQCTGRDMANLMCGYFGITDPMQMMDLCRTDDYWAMSSAAWLFAINKKLIPLAFADNIRVISRRINGGRIGLEERLKTFEKAKKVILS